MRVTIDPALRAPPLVSVGDVYPVRGGRHRDCLWVVVSVFQRAPMFGDGAVALMVDPEGTIIGSANYGLHYFADLNPVGRAEGIEDLMISITRTAP